MKNKLYTIYILLISFLFINITNAESIFNKEETIDYTSEISYRINYIISNKSGYIILSSDFADPTILYLYNQDHQLITSKTISDLTDSYIAKYNQNYILVGISSNSLKVYLLDSNLKVLSQKETSYMINQNAKINIYQYNNKIYLLLTTNSILNDNNIYEIDQDLNITTNNFSSYEPELLKNILKSDYYLLKNNDYTSNDRITHYNSSTYIEDYHILVGDTSNINYDSINGTGYDYQANLTILSSDGTQILNKEYSEYSRFKDVFIIKDKIIVLTTYGSDEKLLTIDFTGNVLEEITLPTSYNEVAIEPYNAYKVNNKIMVYMSYLMKDRLSLELLQHYHFDYSIIKEENPNGTISIKETAMPYEEVSFTITANSGYEIDTILIKDIQGNIITTTYNKFIMPENDVIISVEYKTIVTNPETMDIIVLIGISSFTVLILIIFFRKKLKWLQ